MRKYTPGLAVLILERVHFDAEKIWVNLPGGALSAIGFWAKIAGGEFAGVSLEFERMIETVRGCAIVTGAIGIVE